MAYEILHPVNSFIAQRTYGLIMGYVGEVCPKGLDINDHETLRQRDDTIFALAVAKVINSEQESILIH